jgi:hypothetical protein
MPKAWTLLFTLWHGIRPPQEQSKRQRPRFFYGQFSNQINHKTMFEASFSFDGRIRRMEYINGLTNTTITGTNLTSNT